MNAKNRFRGFGRGAAKSQQFTNLLSKMTKESEENSKKKEIAEQARVNLVNFKYFTICLLYRPLVFSKG